MNTELIIKVLLALEPEECVRIRQLEVRRWASGTGWTVGNLSAENVRGSSSLPFVVRMLEKGAIL